jgi:sulfur carrier protein ThiS
MINVTVSQIPGRSITVTLNDGPTVGEAIEAAGLDGTGLVAALNGLPTELDAPVADGARVVLTRPIKGA